MRGNEIKVNYTMDQKVFDVLIKGINANNEAIEKLNEKFELLNIFIRKIENELIELKLKNEVKGRGI